MDANRVHTSMPTRWWSSVAVCALILGVIAVAMNFDRDTTAAAAPAAVFATAVPQPVAAAEPLARTPVAASYVGNTKSYKFHRNTCRHAGCPNCTARFATREEAIAAGYRPCGVCDP